MRGIFTKGLEKPKKCMTCHLWHQLDEESMCDATGRLLTSSALMKQVDVENGVANDCPIKNAIVTMRKDGSKEAEGKEEIPQ